MVVPVKRRWAHKFELDIAERDRHDRQVLLAGLAFVVGICVAYFA